VIPRRVRDGLARLHGALAPYSVGLVKLRRLAGQRKGLPARVAGRLLVLAVRLGLLIQRNLGGVADLLGRRQRHVLGLYGGIGQTGFREQQLGLGALALAADLVGLF